MGGVSRPSTALAPPSLDQHQSASRGAQSYLMLVLVSGWVGVWVSGWVPGWTDWLMTDNCHSHRGRFHPLRPPPSSSFGRPGAATGDETACVVRHMIAVPTLTWEIFLYAFPSCTTMHVSVP